MPSATDEAAAIVFLHGGGQGAWVWVDTIAAIARQAGDAAPRMLALDVPGCGAKRDRETATLTIEDVADELLAEIAAAGIDRAILIGHSQAGQAMVWMTRRRPDLFAHVLYLACSLPAPGRTLLELIGTGAHGSDPDAVGWPEGTNPTNAASSYDRMFCNDMDAEETAAFLALTGKDMWPADTYASRDWPTDHLAAIPSTYIVCLRDGMLPVAWQHRFADRFGVGRLVLLDAGHQAMKTRPQALAEIIRLGVAQHA